MQLVVQGSLKHPIINVEKIDLSFRAPHAPTVKGLTRLLRLHFQIIFIRIKVWKRGFSNLPSSFFYDVLFSLNLLF